MHKPPIDPVRWTPPPVEPLPEFPSAAITVVPVGGNAPEDVVADAHGAIFTGVDDGRIIRIDPDGQRPVVVGDTGGRPLGLAVARDRRLLICDSHRGLLAMDTGTGSFDVLVESVAGRPLQFCSNVAETSDGTLFFSESTDHFRYENYKGAVLEARPRGRLFRRDPAGTVTTLVEDLYFTNGVTLTADESAVVFAETFGRRLCKYWLTGPAAGTVTHLATCLPGYPDNLSTGHDGRIWCAMASAVNPTAERLATAPPLLRKALWRLPYRMMPNPRPEVWAVAFDPDSGEAVAGIRTRHQAFGLVTGMVESNGRLWMGCIGASAVAYAELESQQ